MKFIFFGYDFSLNIFDRLVADGHEPIGLCTFDCDNVFNFNTSIIARAADLGVSVMKRPPTDVHIADFISQGAELFFSAGYPYKIPHIDESKAYGVNLHPSYLPMGRGLMPVPHIILHAPQAGGLTIHKISDKFDRGDILKQVKLSIGHRETVETYSGRVALSSPDLVSEVVQNIEQFCTDAVPQDESFASYFRPPNDEMRTLDWRCDVDHLDKTLRAFGGVGVLCEIGDQSYIVTDMDAWTQEHNHQAGEVVRQTPREIIIAAGNGFVCLKAVHSVG